MACMLGDRKGAYRGAGFLVCLLAAVTLGLGIADVVTTNSFCTQTNRCTPLTNGLVLTWVSVGIWAAVPIFMTGISLNRFSHEPADKDASKHGWLGVLLFMSTAFFTPAIIAISISEVYFKFYQSGPPGGSSPTVIQALFGLPIAIAILGFLVHLLVLHIFLVVCCCKKHKKVETPAPACPAPPPAAKPGCGEDGADVDRMNIWSAYRWMNGGPTCCDNGGAAARPAAAASYYSGAGGAPPSRCYHVGQMSSAAPCCHGNGAPPSSANVYQYPRPLLNAALPSNGPAVRW